MRARPIRPNIYLPVVRFGVADSDWFSVFVDFMHLLSRTCAFRDHSVVCPVADVDVVAGNCRCNRFLQLHTDRAETLLASASA